uniref:Uncharacterized protein n=1 Tax=Strigamia maritima TaxID=126957 RepID=T1JJP2_STRMM
MNNAGQDLLGINCSSDTSETKQNDEGSNENFLEQRITAEAESPDIVPNDEKSYQEKDANKMINAEVATEDDPDNNSEGDLKEMDGENNEEFNEKQDVDLPDVVPERSETPGKQEDVPSSTNGDANGNDSGTLRSILKRERNKKIYIDLPVICNEISEPISNLISLIDSSFDIKMEENFWDDFDKNKEYDEDSKAIPDDFLDFNISADSLSHLEHTMIDGNNLDSDSETNSSQDTVILMTTEENKRNEESIQQSQRRYQLHKTKSDDDSPSYRTSELRSNSTVRKCLERTALRRSLTQCANTRRKTLETKPSSQVPSIMEKLRLLTRDSDDAKTSQTSGEVAAAMNSLPRLDLQEVHEMINTRCPLKDVYSNPKEEVNVPGDVREWKMSSKLWDHCANNNHEDEVNDNVDELERFVQQDWERIERVRQRYTPEPHDAYMEICRRPSVRGIRPRFGSTHQIINQLQQQRQPPTSRHESLSNINCIDPSRDLECAYNLNPKLSQSFQSLEETKWPLYVTLASSNPNRLSCPPEYFQPEMQFSPDYLQNSNRLSSCENVRFTKAKLLVGDAAFAFSGSHSSPLRYGKMLLLDDKIKFGCSFCLSPTVGGFVIELRIEPKRSAIFHFFKYFVRMRLRDLSAGDAEIYSESMSNYQLSS